MIGEKIEVKFFNGLEEVIRVCFKRVSSTHTYTHFFIYDKNDYGDVEDLYSGSNKEEAKRYMEFTGNMTIEDEEFFRG